MKAPAGLELAAFAAVLLTGMILVMWAQGPAPACELRPEAIRRLVLSRQVDREHLEADLANVDRVSRRHVRAFAGASDQQTRFLECQATLIDRLAATHGLSPERIRGAPADVQ